jgi:hypothetical protein
MGRPALTDAAKLAKGTFDPRYSEEARAERSGQTVVAFPTLQEIPECRFPLEPGGIGQQTYDRLIRTLHEQGRLTMLTHMKVEILAAGMEDLRNKMASGMRVPAGLPSRLMTSIAELERESVDRAFNGSSVKGQENKFLSNGFAARRR